MRKTPHFQAVDDLAYVIECAAIDHMGEGKRELIDLCGRLEGDPAYMAIPDAADLAAKLRTALASFRAGDEYMGASILSQVSRRMRESLFDA